MRWGVIRLVRVAFDEIMTRASELPGTVAGVTSALGHPSQGHPSQVRATRASSEYRTSTNYSTVGTKERMSRR